MAPVFVLCLSLHMCDALNKGLDSVGFQAFVWVDSFYFSLMGKKKNNVAVNGPRFAALHCRISATSFGNLRKGRG